MDISVYVIDLNAANQTVAHVSKLTVDFLNNPPFEECGGNFGVLSQLSLLFLTNLKKN